MPKVSRITDQAETEISYMFDCPACGISHSARVQAQRPGVPMWTWNGSLDRPTFHPSLKVQWARRQGEEQVPVLCHFFVVDGRIQYLNDCTHEMAGKTVELPEVE